MSSISLFFVVMWCILKPLLFIILPTLLLGELMMFGTVRGRRRVRSNMC